MRPIHALAFFLALSAPITPLFSLDLHQETGVSCPDCCHCEPDCECKKPGGTCPVGGPCVEDCQCDKKTQIGDQQIFIHPDMKTAIERNESVLRGFSGMAADPESDRISVNGVEQFTGFKPTLDFYRGRKVINIEVDPNVTLPKNLDYRKFSHSPVRGQVQGSCWAEGNVSATELNWNAVLGTKLVFAVDDVIQCSGFGSARRGGQLSMEYNLKEGLAFEEDYPYTGRDGKCRKDVERHYPLLEVAFLRGAKGGFVTEPELMAAVNKYGAMEVCGSASSLGSGGRQDNPRRGSTNHCYAYGGYLWGPDMGWLEGYYHLIKNSWGDGSGSELSNGRSWGDKGWGMYRLSRNGVKLEGSVITEIQVGYAGPIRPREPVIFEMDTPSLKLKITIAPTAIQWTKESLSKAIEELVKELEAA